MKLFFLVGFIFVAFLVHTYAEETGAKDCIIDLQLIVDSSGSVGEDHFNQMMEDIAEKFLRSFHIGPLQTRVGLFQYSNLMRNEFDLDKYSDVESLIKATEAIKYIGGETYTGQAMNESLVHFEEKMRKDNETKKVCIVFTDGAPTERKEAIEIPEVTRKWRDLGVHVFAVGIGPDILHTGLVAIAGNEDNALSVVDFSNLTKSIEPLKNIICTLPQITSPPQYPANTTPIPPIPPIPSLDPTVKCKCPGDHCCPKDVIDIKCHCEPCDDGHPGFSMTVVVCKAMSTYFVDFGRDCPATPLLAPGPGDCCGSVVSGWKPDGHTIASSTCGTSLEILHPGETETVIQYKVDARLYEGKGLIMTDDIRVELTCNCTLANPTLPPIELLTKPPQIVDGYGTTPLDIKINCGPTICCDEDDPLKIGHSECDALCAKDTKECCLKEQVCVEANWCPDISVLPDLPPETELEIFALNCWVTPDASRSSETRMELVKDGCAVKSTAEVVLKKSSASEKFCFQAFRFNGPSPHQMYVHCELLVCKLGASDSRCAAKKAACAASPAERRKRSVDSGSYLMTREVMVGPITMNDARDTSYAVRDVMPRHKFWGARRRLDKILRRLGKL